MTRAEKLEAAGAFMHCTCPRDDEGVRERAWVDRVDTRGRKVREWFHLTNPTCPLHGKVVQPAPF